jgi:hypothetical protein
MSTTTQEQIVEMFGEPAPSSVPVAEPGTERSGMSDADAHNAKLAQEVFAHRRLTVPKFSPEVERRLDFCRLSARNRIALSLYNLSDEEIIDVLETWPLQDLNNMWLYTTPQEKYGNMFAAFDMHPDAVISAE